MADIRPIGVCIPTRNCAGLAASHLVSLQGWAGLAEEIVVVDSDSQDGTVEIFKEGLSGLPVKFLTHPPGLYQSWNFGIRNITAKYACISTVGDTISREGIEHLLAVAEEFHSDVVVSKPAFMADATRPAADIRWAVDDLIETLEVSRPRKLSWLEVLLFTAFHLDGTLLGSSASNLYRTAALQKFPFPTDFGKAGDAAWAAGHFADVKWAVTPEKFSTFLRHADWTAAAEVQNWKTAPRLDKVLREAIENAAANGTIPRAVLEAYAVSELLDAAAHWLDAKQAFDRRRARRWPWFLNPGAWKRPRAPQPTVPPPPASPRPGAGPAQNGVCSRFLRPESSGPIAADSAGLKPG